MKVIVAAITVLIVPCTAFAVDLSLSKASSIAPVPTGTVMRIEMAAPDGMESLPARKRPDYEVTGYKQVGSGPIALKSVPRPEFNPARVSFCPSETY